MNTTGAPVHAFAGWRPPVNPAMRFAPSGDMRSYRRRGKGEEHGVSAAMKVIGFIGSARRGGNTEALVMQALAGARDAGAHTRVFYLNELEFLGCQGCGYCKHRGVCRLQDDMQQLYEEILVADGIVLGSPVYFGQMSGQTKCFLDRWYALVNPDFSSRIPPGKRMAMFFPQGDRDPAMYEGMMEHLRVTMGFFGLDVIEAVIAPGLLGLGEAKADPELMERAARTGRELARKTGT
jgi:multimeric flavodoxin WrbA